MYATVLGVYIKDIGGEQVSMFRTDAHRPVIRNRTCHRICALNEFE